MSSFKEITTDEVYDIYQQTGSVHLIDVREVDEFADASAPISQNLPLSRINENPEIVQTLGIPKDEPIYLICRSGRRSARACEIFAEQGFERMYNVSGGMLDWQAKLLPTQ